MQNRFKSCQRMLKHTQQKNKTLELDCTKTTRHIKSLQIKVHKLERTVWEFEGNDFDPNELQELRNWVEEYEADKTELEELREQAATFEEGAEELEELREQNEELEELKEQNEELEELREQNEELQSRIGDLEAIESNVEDICPWSDNFIEDVQAAWPKRHESRYRRVKVLVVRWSSDDLGVSAELANLGRVFKCYYGYEVEYYLIPDYQASTAMSRRVLGFIGNDSPDTLRILYYGGHGSIDPERNCAVWSA